MEGPRRLLRSGAVDGPGAPSAESNTWMRANGVLIDKKIYFPVELRYVLLICVIAMRYSKIITFALVAFFGLPALIRAQTTASARNADSSARDDFSISWVPPTLKPQPEDGSIAYITARLLEEYHYTRHLFDTEMSERLYDLYLSSYDPQHSYFLQSDIDDFSHYRTNLDVLTIGGNGRADVTPAYYIYARFIERLRQRVEYSDELLKHDNFKFTSNEQVQLDRKDAPYPKDMAEAKRLWRRQVMYDFLREKLDREDAAGTVLAATNAEAISDLLKHRYERDLRYFEEWDSGDVLQDYLDSLARAYDPHSDYLNNEHSQDFSISMSLALFGIGAELTSDDGYCKIESLVPGGPAYKSSQLKPDDKIIAVAQGKQAPVDVVDMELSKIVQLIRGPKGTEVRLTIIPADDPKSRRVVTLIRAEINLRDEEAKAMLIETPNGDGGTNRLGIIDVPSFYAPVNLTSNPTQTTNYVSDDVAALVQKLVKEKVGGIILDMRNNPGGSLEEAIRFVGLFATNGPVVQIRSPDNPPVPGSNDEDLNIYQGPLLVLVNRFSASAAEIVTAALQDYGRAVVVGDTSTFGKGTVQNLTPLRPFIWATSESVKSDPGTAKITIRKFYRINGASTQLKGVIPDIILPDVLSYSDEIGESSLPYALPWDTIAPSDYTPMNYVQPYLPALLKDSEARVATNQDFTYMKEDIAELEKLQDEKTDTLNERKAWDEKEKLEAQKDARSKEISSRPIPDETMFQITLADAAKSGLPPAIRLLKAKPDSGSLYLAVYPTNNLDSVIVTNSIGPDPMLDESERILEDYISRLQAKTGVVAASHE